MTTGASSELFLEISHHAFTVIQWPFEPGRNRGTQSLDLCTVLCFILVQCPQSSTDNLARVCTLSAPNAVLAKSYPIPLSSGYFSQASQIFLIHCTDVCQK